MNIKNLFRNAPLVTLSVLIVLNLILYSQIFPSFFFADDFDYIYFNIASSPLELFNKIAYLSFTDFFRPIFYLIFGLNYAIFHLNYHGYYLINMFFHILNGYLVFILCSRLMKDRFAPVLAAILFTVFPGHWEAIGWLNPINHLTMTAAYLTSMILFLDFLDNNDRKYLFISSLTFFLALSCHESSLTFIIMAICIYLLKKNSIAAVKMAKDFTPYLAVLALYFVINIYTKIVLLSGPMKGQYALGWHFIPNLMEYLSTLVVPVTVQYKLSGLIPGDILHLIMIVKYALYFIIPVVLIYILFKGDLALKFFSIWPVIALIPFSFFTTAHTSRYMYLASVGFCSSLSIIAMSIYKRGRSNIARYFVVTAISILVIAYLLTSIAYQKVFYHKKEIRKDILTDFMRLSPSLDPRTHYYFLDLPIRDDEIKYMLYLWYQKDKIDIKIIDKGQAESLSGRPNTKIYRYDHGHLVRLK